MKSAIYGSDAWESGATCHPKGSANAGEFGTRRFEPGDECHAFTRSQMRNARLTRSMLAVSWHTQQRSHRHCHRHLPMVPMNFLCFLS